MQWNSTNFKLLSSLTFKNITCFKVIKIEAGVTYSNIITITYYTMIKFVSVLDHIMVSYYNSKLITIVVAL